MIRELTDAEFHATFREPIQHLSEALSEEAITALFKPISLFEYVEECIFAHDLPTSVETIEIHQVFLIGDGAFTHVLFFFGMANVYLATIIDQGTNSVFGYHFLDLNEKYGLDQPLVC